MVRPEVDSWTDARYKRDMKFPRAILFEIGAVIVVGVTLLYLNVLSIFTNIQGVFLQILPSLLTFFLIIIGAKLLLDLSRRPFEKAASLYMKSQADIRMVWTMISYAVWFLILIIFLFYVFSEFLVALLGLALIIGAIIYVLGKPITNFAGWFAIVARRPFKIGDRIAVKSQQGAVQGYVVELTLMHIVLREFEGWMKGDTFTGRLLFVPISTIFDSHLYNYDKYAPFIYDEVTISVTYESDIELAEKVIQRAAEEVVGKDMRANFPKVVRLLEMKDLVGQMMEHPTTMVSCGSSSVDISVIYFCRTNLRRFIKSEVTRRILQRINETKNVTIAYPHMQLVGKVETGAAH